MKIYRGTRNEDGCVVEVFDTDGQVEPHRLEPRNDLRNHSPDGFEWGYGGSGPAQLSLALLMDVIEDEALALHFYQQFKWACVGHLPNVGWGLSEDDIRAIVNNLKVPIHE